MTSLDKSPEDRTMEADLAEQNGCKMNAEWTRSIYKIKGLQEMLSLLKKISGLFRYAPNSMADVKENALVSSFNLPENFLSNSIATEKNTGDEKKKCLLEEVAALLDLKLSSIKVEIINEAQLANAECSPQLTKLKSVRLITLKPLSLTATELLAKSQNAWTRLLKRPNLGTFLPPCSKLARPCVPLYGCASFKSQSNRRCQH